MDDNRLFGLYELYYKGLATPAQTDELMQLLEALPDEKLSELLSKTWANQDINQGFFTSATREKLLGRLQPAVKPEADVRPIQGQRNTFFLRIAVAAAVLVVVSAITLFFLRKENGTLVADRPRPQVIQDMAPGGDKAILTLGDGRTIVLDTAANGGLAQQGGVNVIKIGGQLTYNAERSSTEVLYNTISTPKGGQYQLELADGSRVWLNAASSLRFPTAFTGKDRMVELTGEGYFEVAHDPGKPFHVKVNDMDVRVLGTHFNINSYGDEPLVRTTLLEGRVNVNRNGKLLFLNPGQQAIVTPGEDAIKVAYNVDVEQVVAWKNGRFLFNGADIETIMRQAARWYNMEVIYEKKPSETFSGSLPRTENFSQLIRVLEATGKVDIRVSGKQVIVKGK